MRWLGRIALGLLAAVILVVLVAALSLRTRWVHRILLRHALPPLARLLGGPVKARELDGDLLGNLTLHDVEIDDAAGRPLIVVARAYARYDLGKLLRGNYTIEEVRLSGGWVTFAPDDEGKLRLAGIGRRPGTSSSGPTPSIDFPLVTIDARAEVPQRALSGVVHVEGSLNIGEEVRVSVERGQADVSPTAGFDISGSTVIGERTSFENLILDVHSDGARVLALAGSRAPVHGDFSAHAEANGPIDALGLRLRLWAPAGTFDADGVVSLLHGTGRLRARGQRIQVARFIAGAPRGSVSVEATLSRQTSGVFGGSGRVVIDDVRAPRLVAERIATTFALSGDASRLRVTLDHMELARHQIKLRSRGPAAVLYTFGDTVRLQRLRLVSGEQWLAVSADYRIRSSRLEASLDARIEGNPLHAHLVLPLTARHGDRLDGQAQLSLAVDRDLLTRLRPAAPVIGWLDGSRVNLQFRVSGTFAHPEASLDGDLTLATPGPVAGNAHLAARYQSGRAHVSLSATAADSSNRRIGGMDAQLESALGVELTGAHPRIGAIEHAPLQGTLKVSGLLLQGLRAFGLRLPFRSGVVDASVELAGELAAPTARAHVTARDLVSGQLRKLNLDLSTVLQPDEATTDLQIGLEGQPLAKLHARADLRRRPWRDAPIQAQLTLVPYPLGRVAWLAHGIDGVLRGQLDFAGTVAAPRASAQLHVDGLQLGRVHYDDVTLTGQLDGHMLSARARVMAGGAEQASADASLALEPDAQLQLSARLDHFMVDLRSETLPSLRVLTAVLDGEAHVQGPLAHPRIDGRISVSKGVLALQASPTSLHDLALQASLHDDQLVIDKLTVAADEGTASATARGTLAEGRLVRLSGQVSTHRFPVSQGGLSAWLDVESDVSVEKPASRTQVQVTVRRALIELPELASEKPLQSTGPLEDVVFVGAAAQNAKPPPDVEILVATAAPIQMRSPEAKLDLRLDLRVAPAAGGLGVWGHIDGPHGQLTLLGRRYDVDRLRVAFDGSTHPNPVLDVRVTRPMSDALMMVEVHGNANRPQVTFRSDPPIYTESQVLGEFISGDTEAANVSTRSLDQQAIGAVSSLVVGKLKDELAPKLPIDLIKIDVGNEGYSDVGGSVEAGKYLTDNLYLAYVHQFGSAPGARPINHNEGRLDLRFLRHMLLETHFGDAAVGGIDVFWTKRF